MNEVVGFGIALCGLGGLIVACLCFCRSELKEINEKIPSYGKSDFEYQLHRLQEQNDDLSERLRIVERQCDRNRETNTMLSTLVINQTTDERKEN